MIADFHNDVLTASMDIKTLSKETDCCVCALFRGSRNFAQLRETAEHFLSERPDSLLLGLEDIGYFSEETEEEIFSWRPVYASLTWNDENALAGGCMSDGQLTPKGRQVVRKLSRRHICVDCAHLNKVSFSALLDSETYCIIDSHTCLNGVNRHPRNLDDWQVKEIADRGGLIGIAFVGRFLREGGEASSEDIFRHIDYGVQKFGVDFFCLGSDFNGTDDLPRDVRGYSDLSVLRERFYRAGYKESYINNIFYFNIRRFISSHFYKEN